MEAKLGDHSLLFQIIQLLLIIFITIAQNRKFHIFTVKLLCSLKKLYDTTLFHYTSHKQELTFFIHRIRFKGMPYQIHAGTVYQAFTLPFNSEIPENLPVLPVLEEDTFCPLHSDPVKGNDKL